MFIVLSQKIDTESTYLDELFLTYHYPARYKNQIHEDDVFVYYQGNRYVKEQRYYFGTGVVKKITVGDDGTYYAELKNVRRFEKNVPIYLPNNKYIEQLGYETVRKSPNPPWQSSIRPLSVNAYQYIVDNAGALSEVPSRKTIETLKEELKDSIKSFYLENDNEAIFRIQKISTEIASAMSKV